MFPGPAARRTAAGLTAVLVAVLLVTFGGPTHAPTQRAAASGSNHAGAVTKAARVQHAVVPAHHHQTPLHLDLATTLPGTAPDVRDSGTIPALDDVAVRTGSDLVTPTGRAPPAL